MELWRLVVKIDDSRLYHSDPSCKKNITRSHRYFAQKYQMDDIKVLLVFSLLKLHIPAQVDI